MEAKLSNVLTRYSLFAAILALRRQYLADVLSQARYEY